MGAIGGTGVSIEEALPLDGSRAMTGPLNLTIADTDNVVGLLVTQNDTTNNPVAASIVNAGTGSGLSIDQNGNGISIDIDSEATTADIVNIAATVLTTGNVIDIPDADALTTGKIVNLVSDSADTGTRDLIKVTNDNTLATGVTCLNIQQDSAQRAVLIDQNADGKSLEILSTATTANAIHINNPSITTGSALAITSADSLTTGRLLTLTSNSADTGTRDLARITNDNTAATGTSCLRLDQDAANHVLILVNNSSTAGSSFIDFRATGAADTVNPISTLTTSGATTQHLQIEINGTKAWIAISTNDPS